MKYLLVSALFISSMAIAGTKTTKVMDGDKDGIADSMDKCQQTPAGKAVNEFGCLKGETITMKLNILYPSGSSKLGDEAAPHLDKIATYLKSYPDAKLELEGYADNTGSEKRNEKVSQARVDEVKNYLVKKEGVSDSQVVASGFGVNQSFGDNTTKEGRAENRRVVGTIVQ